MHEYTICTLATTKAIFSTVSHSCENGTLQLIFGQKRVSRFVLFWLIDIRKSKGNALLRCEQRNTDASAYHLKHSKNATRCESLLNALLNEAAARQSENPQPQLW